MTDRYYIERLRQICWKPFLLLYILSVKVKNCFIMLSEKSIESNEDQCTNIYVLHNKCIKKCLKFICVILDYDNSLNDRSFKSLRANKYSRHYYPLFDPYILHRILTQSLAVDGYKLKIFTFCAFRYRGWKIADALKKKRKRNTKISSR